VWGEIQDKMRKDPGIANLGRSKAGMGRNMKGGKKLGVGRRTEFRGQTSEKKCEYDMKNRAIWEELEEIGIYIEDGNLLKDSRMGESGEREGGLQRGRGYDGEEI